MKRVRKLMLREGWQYYSVILGRHFLDTAVEADLDCMPSINTLSIAPGLIISHLYYGA